ncbi:ArsR/SmtB family transcription factor [Streptomyces olivochromogenes]|uniref:ArsR/SmtB family transcription factor n=1 Tax=Streptomyces olivochromogenes TaxID=1963 RepID=UPI0036D9E627
MVCLRLTVEDLSHIRFVGSLGPDIEARFAEIRYADVRPDEFAEWRMKVRRRLRRAPVSDVPGARSLRKASSAAPHIDARRFSAAAVEPFWGRIREYLELEREARGRHVLSGGVDGVLNELHPSISWHAPFLRVDDEQEGESAELFGEGLVVAPSLFAPAPVVLDAETGGQGAPVLVYNVTPTTDSAAGLWHQQEEDRAAALSDLLGHTRAHVLESLRSPSSIGEISRLLDVSHPSVSKHLAVLRRSGLVAAERRTNLTVHRLTHLGEAVLGRQD